MAGILEREKMQKKIFNCDGGKNGVTVLYGRNDKAATSYYEVLIPLFADNDRKTKIKVCATSPTSMLGDWNCINAKAFSEQHDYLVVMNAGIFLDPFSREADGITIIDGIIVKASGVELFPQEQYVLGITETGDFKTYYYEKAEKILQDSCIYAITGFVPLLEEGEPVSTEILSVCPHWNEPHPRQIIGRLINGDYFIFTCDGRSDHEKGMTLLECMHTILKDFGESADFAFVLDGGGSTQTMVGKIQINAVIENRTVPNVIVFE